jgi:hypothetical protein
MGDVSFAVEIEQQLVDVKHPITQLRHWPSFHRRMPRRCA